MTPGFRLLRLLYFAFDSKKWEEDRKGYLLSLGIEADLVHKVLNNPDHRCYIPPPSIIENEKIVITINAETIRKITEEVIERVKRKRGE